MRHLFLFIAQLLNFLFTVVNIRALNRSKVLLTMVTDFAICVGGFLIVKVIAEAKDWTEAISYAAGGACGSALAIYLTKHWDHEQARTPGSLHRADGAAPAHLGVLTQAKDALVSRVVKLVR